MKEYSDSSAVRYPELSYSIVGAAMNVHNTLGPGWTERDYHLAMIESLREKGHKVLSHDRQDLVHRGTVVDHFELDLLVDNLVILELKHMRSAFQPVHLTQIINYLKRWKKQLGMLINFGLERLAYKRIPYDPVRGTVCAAGKLDELTQRYPLVSKRMVEAVEGVIAEYGYGYGVRTFQCLLIEELRFLGSEAQKPVLEPRYGNKVFERREIDCVMVDSKMLISITASGRDSSSADLACLKSYMKHMGISCGAMVDIGRSAVKLKGVM